jgi:uncharacterized protein (TIGR03435 family)
MTPIQFLAEWVVRSSFLILAGATLLRLLRVESPAIRLAAWTAVLAGSLAIPGLTRAVPRLPIVYMRRATPQPASVPAARSISHNSSRVAPPTAARDLKAKGTDVAPFDWSRAAVIVYAMVASVLLLRLITGFLFSLALLRRSRRTGNTDRGIEIRESGEIASPVTMGILRPAILLPLDWRTWDGPKLRAALAHEGSHIRRHDPVIQFLSAIHRALLWLSPATWYLHRSIVRTAEEVSDDDAVASVRDRASYAEVLLDFIQRGVGPAGWPLVPMALYDRPEKRIRRILNATALSQRVTRWGAATVLLVGASLAWLAAAAQPQSKSRPLQFASAAAIPTSALSSAAATPDAAPEPSSQNAAPRAPVTTEALHFDSANLRPTDPTGRHLVGVNINPAGKLQIIAVDLKSLISIAFDLPYRQISGGEPWVEKQNFDLETSFPSSIVQNIRHTWYGIQDENLRAMLQTLLIERFQLAVHRETRTGDVLLLEQSGEPLRLRQVQPQKSDGFESFGYAGGQWDISDAAMPQFARFAGDFIFHIPVLDRTGLSGLYHYRQAVPDSEPKYSGDQSPSFLKFLAETGLKVERSTGPIDSLVIDRAVKPSSF